MSRQLNQRKSSQLEGEGHDDYENQETEKKTRTNWFLMISSINLLFISENLQISNIKIEKNHFLHP